MRNCINKNVEETQRLLEHVKMVNRIINEENNKSTDNIPYQKEEDIYAETIETCIQLFGARFDVENPIMYSPSDKNVIVNGSLNGWDNSSFTFKLNDNTGNGCYVYIDMLQLNDENIKRLSTINSVYQNWKNTLITKDNIEPDRLKNN